MQPRGPSDPRSAKQQQPTTQPPMAAAAGSGAGATPAAAAASSSSSTAAASTTPAPAPVAQYSSLSALSAFSGMKAYNQLVNSKGKSESEQEIEQLGAAMKQLCTNSTLVEAMEALETLLIYIKNLILFADEKKYRKVKHANIHYQERLGHLKGADDAMGAVGYKPSGEYLRLDEKKMARPDAQATLRSMEQLVNAELQDVRYKFGLLPHRLDTDTHKFQSVAGAAAHHDMGKRPNMEDDEIICEPFANENKSAFFGVYDGHGGRGTVNFVVKVLHSNFEQQLVNFPTRPVPEAWKNAYLLTDGQLRRQNILQSGTTSVTAFVRLLPNGKRWLYAANAGDSRAVLCRGGKAIRLTIDHKASVPEEAKRITDAGGFVGRNRVNGVLAVSRALGDHMLKENDVVTAVPYCFDTEVHGADTTDPDAFLILACDGVWDVMTDQEACDFVYKKAHAIIEEDDGKAGKHTTFAQENLNALFAPPTPDTGNHKASELVNHNGAAAAGAGGAAAAAAAAGAGANKGSGSGAFGSLRLKKGSKLNMSKVCELAARALVNRALELKSLDNVTVMVVIF